MILLLGKYYEARFPMENLNVEDAEVLNWMWKNGVELTFSYPYLYFNKSEDLTAFRLAFGI